MNWKFPKYEVGQELDWEDLYNSFDWIRDMQGVPQDPIWHAEGNVFIHTKMVVESLVNLPDFIILSEQDKHILLVAALLHDVEKRSTTREEEIDGKLRIVSPSHAKKGEFTARELLYKEWNVPFRIREQICKLVRLHGLPIWAITKSNPKKEVIYASTLVNTKHLALLARADILGRICEDAEEILLKIDLFEELCKEHNCWGKERDFVSDHSRFNYFQKDEASPDYKPFDDLICTVTMMCALPGSGKDTYIKKYLDQPQLSLDNIRRALKISPTDKKANGRVIQLAKEQAKEFLRAKTDFVFNATNITSDMRSRWISLFVDYNARVRIVYIEVPYQKLMRQNARRDYVVPKNAIDRMISKLEIPTVKEAHEVGYVVNT